MLRLCRGTFFYMFLSCLKTLFFLLPPILLPPFFFLLQTLSSRHPSCRFPLSTSAIPTIHLSYPLSSSHSSSLSIAFILSQFAINPLSPHSPFPTIPASLTVKPFLTHSLALLHRGAENLFIYEFVRHEGRRELEKNRQKPNW